MGSFSIWHWLMVLAIVVIIFGTKKLRNIGGDLGGAIKDLQGVDERRRRQGQARRRRAKQQGGSKGKASRWKPRSGKRKLDRASMVSRVRVRHRVLRNWYWHRPGGAPVVLGPKRLPEVARAAGAGQRACTAFIEDTTKREIDREDQGRRPGGAQRRCIARSSKPAIY